MSYPSWRERKFSAEARRESMNEAQAKFDKMRRDRIHKATYCQCGRPVPSMSSHMGWRTCRLCQRLIYKE